MKVDNEYKNLQCSWVIEAEVRSEAEETGEEEDEQEVDEAIGEENKPTRQSKEIIKSLERHLALLYF